jgi:2-oxo-4-hydroxy-4-carboxy-5-ureidoimidazoline decarboxylase
LEVDTCVTHHVLDDTMTLADANTMTRDRFVSSLGWAFEHSPWVAERAWHRRPFASIEQLHEAMMAEVLAAHADEQRALLRAHPDLGARARMSDASKGEQAGAGLDSLSRADFERLHTLNASYRERFGFPFLFAVKGRSARDILTALEARLSASVEDELAEALRQVSRIAWFRLQDAVST